jgi:thiol:disulfide interchange protein DsbC
MFLNTSMVIFVQKNLLGYNIMPLSRARALVALGFSIFSSLSMAGPYEAAIADQISKGTPGVQVENVKKSAIDGLYQVQVAGGGTLFSTQDGHYFILGDLYERKPDNSMVNLSELQRKADTAKKLAEIPPEKMIVYPAIGERKAFMTVFSDPECPYCRKMHELIPSYNELGIEVRYLAYPRAGLGSEIHEKMASAWCSPKPTEAMNTLFAGGSIPVVRCENPVAEEFQLGVELGVRGTPTIFLPSGKQVLGALPTEHLLKELGIKK